MSALVSGVLCLPALAGGQQAPTQVEIEAAVDRGVSHLLAIQSSDGSWPYHVHQTRSGCTGLVLYALLKSGIDPAHPAVKRALVNLNRAPVQGTYDAACVLLALSAHDAAQHRDWIAELADQLIDWQTARGDWGYPGGGDLSNTQYAALGLRAAVLSGLEVPAEVWAELERSLGAYDGERGSFSYGRNARGGSGSMTAAGVGTLAICESMLARAGASSPEASAERRRRIERGLAWLARRFDDALDLRAGWAFYRLYGIERVGALLALAEIGGQDWYAAGATALLAAQGQEGCWSKGGRPAGQPDMPSTAWALLFLKRATHSPVTGFATRTGSKPAGARAVETPPDGASVRLRVTGEDPVTVWITGFGEGLLARWEWPGEKGRGPHVERVEYFAGRRHLATVPADPRYPSELERFAIQHHFHAPGTYALRARVHVVGPPPEHTGPEELDDPSIVGGGAVIESPPLEVTVEDVVPAWELAQANDRVKNLAPGARPRASGSSSLEGFEAFHAIDNRARTSWLADADDPEPRLVVVYDEPVRADVILFRNALSLPFEAGALGRALEVEVSINNGPARLVAMPPDERQKGRLELDSPRIVHSLALEIRWNVPGSAHPNVGFSEVELQESERP